MKKTVALLLISLTYSTISFAADKITWAESKNATLDCYLDVNPIAGTVYRIDSQSFPMMVPQGKGSLDLLIEEAGSETSFGEGVFKLKNGDEVVFLVKAEVQWEKSEKHMQYIQIYSRLQHPDEGGKVHVLGSGAATSWGVKSSAGAHADIVNNEVAEQMINNGIYKQNGFNPVFGPISTDDLIKKGLIAKDAFRDVTLNCSTSVKATTEAPSVK